MATAKRVSQAVLSGSNHHLLLAPSEPDICPLKDSSRIWDALFTENSATSLRLLPLNYFGKAKHFSFSLQSRLL